MLQPRSLAEVVLLVSDVSKSLSFYRDALGLKVISPDLGGPVFLQIGEHEGVPHQIVLVPRRADAPPFPERPLRSLHHIGIEVALEDIEAARSMFEGRGVEVRTGTHPFLPVDAIYVDDPDGNEVELVARN